MNDLSVLSQEVREAFSTMELWVPDVDGLDAKPTAWGIIRDELLRLARENAELRTRINGAHVYKVDYKDGVGMFELDGETDFDILERLNGKRVALVPVEE